MQVQAALLGIFPVGGQRGVGVGLMYDFGNQFFSTVNGTGVGTGELSARDSIAGAVDDEQCEKGPDAVDEECDNGEVDEQEDQDAFPHGEKTSTRGRDAGSVRGGVGGGGGGIVRAGEKVREREERMVRRQGSEEKRGYEAEQQRVHAFRAWRVRLRMSGLKSNSSST